MNSVPSALAFLLMIFAGWLNRQQLIAIEYLKAESEMLRERLKGQRLRFSDAERRCWQGKPRRWVARRCSNWVRS